MKIDLTNEFSQIRLKLLGGWWTVRVAGGSNYKKQIEGVRNSEKICDSKIWIDKKHKAIIGISIETEPQKTTVGGTLNVSSSIGSLIVATKQQNETPFVITGDKAKQWAAERYKKYKRISQDRKSGKRQALNKISRRVGDKWKNRIDSFTHEVSSQIVSHAKRRKVAKLTLDFTIKSWSKKFAWFDLAQKIKYKCEDAGIEFVEITQTVRKPDVNKPHVYFKLDPSSNRVKIGHTTLKDGSWHKNNTNSSEELLILAVDNQPKNAVKAKEKHWQAYFADHRLKGEWFEGEPIITWLKESGWIGNANNLAEISQVITV